LKDIEYCAPRSLADAVHILSELGNRARLLAGGTDIIVQVREHRRDLDMLVDAKNIPELNEIAYDPQNGLRLGAAVPCCQIYEHAAIAKAYPGLMDAVTLIGGIQIQSRASVGGNLCNASPAADTVPALIAHAAICTLAGPGGTRKVPAEKFCTAPGKTVLEKGELLVSLHLPPPKESFGASYMRFIPRNEMDIAVVGVGSAVTLDESKSRCVAARIALAAVAPTPLFVADAGAALVDGLISETLIEKAAALARAAARPISDMRGTADYRRHLVGVLVQRTLYAAIRRAKEN
jgi:carbon-monoxide dehydrogenase medium subunit